MAQSPPKSIWPDAPMLKRPVLNAKATASPVMMSGVAVASVFPIRSVFMSPPRKRNV